MAKLRKASCLLLFVLLFASCSRPVPDSGKDVPILPSVGLKRSFSVSTDVDIVSKAAINAGDPMPLYFFRVDESAVGAADFYDEIFNQGDADNLVFAEVPDYLASIDLTPIHFNPLQVYLEDGRSTLMAGWHPYAEWYLDSRYGLILEWAIDGSQDIMIANTQEGDAENRDIMEFTFDHRLAQIQFYIKSESPVASTYWGNLANIEMVEEANAFDTSGVAFDQYVQDAEKKMAEKAEMERKAVLQEIKNRYPDAVTTNTGLMYVIEREGTGNESPKYGENVTVHYEGSLLNGRVFDSSLARREPATFRIGQVIEGWNEALQTMKKGEKRTLIIPPELGYGEYGYPGVIPPNSYLIFNVELLSF